MKRAKIIVIEGTDGSGKATQSDMLLKHYTNEGLKVKKFSFPIYESATGKIIGGPYLGKTDICETYFSESGVNVDPIVCSLYYAADRRYNFLKEIEKEIYKNDILILDRYVTSNMGHQACKATSLKKVDKILDFINVLEYNLCELPKPDLVIFLHMPFKASVDLRKNRAVSDCHESNTAYLKKSESTYLYICKKYKWNYINCIKGKYKSKENIKHIDEISEEIIKIIDKSLKLKSSKLNKMTKF